MSSARFLRYSVSRRLVSLLRSGAPATAVVHSAAPHQHARMHVLPGATPAIHQPILWSFNRSIASKKAAEEVVVEPISVSATAAYDLLKAGHRYLDVRTAEEFSAGHVLGAVNIPYMFDSASGMLKNPDFIEEVSSIFKKDDKIIVGCRSGKRSLTAASELLNAGFSGVTDVAGGYMHWVEKGLPAKD